MKLRTSYFNASVLKKDITRFAPLWGLYTVFTVIFVILSAMDREAAHFANNASEFMRLMGPVNLVYAGICAMLLFGDLFNSRLCNALHAMPIRREGWFLTHLAAGLLMCLVPNAAGALVASAYLGRYCYLAFLWLGIAVLEFLFFFGVGVFSVMCTGNKLGMAAVYCLINFFAVLAVCLIDCFYAPVFYGMVFDQNEFSRLCPCVQFANSKFVQTEFDNMYGITRFLGFVPEDWWYLWIAAAVGTVLLVAAGVLYRKRKLECAGDFIVLKPVAYVFLILYSLGAGALLFYISDMNVLFLSIGMAVGFFTGRMMLERKVNVFRGRNFLGLGALAGALVLTVLLTFWDPMGFTRYVPQTQQIKYVSISSYASQYYRQTRSVLLDDRADVEVVTEIHRDLAMNRSYGGDLPLYIRYEMEDGTVVERAYDLAADSENGQKLRKIYSREEVVLSGYDRQTILENAKRIEFSSYYGDMPYVGILPQGEEQDQLVLMEKYGSQEVKVFHVDGSFADSELVQGLMEAVAQDCREGNMAQQVQFHEDQKQIGWLYISCQHDRYSYMDINIELYGDCYHTLQYLKTIAEG